ncbi:hypothetical protein E2C01_005243 [Portunus trituberculatus]|uniref:Secreted protein n=1 Tax=Portunus trituberculatus TaxID=210409 RepID=A0A5B7CV11_PORTR|nr:hypothetical protein [Portunus trituberculatus]
MPVLCMTDVATFYIILTGLHAVSHNTWSVRTLCDACVCQSRRSTPAGSRTARPVLGTATLSVHTPSTASRRPAGRRPQDATGGVGVNSTRRLHAPRHHPHVHTTALGGPETRFLSNVPHQSCLCSERPGS